VAILSAQMNIVFCASILCDMKNFKEDQMEFSSEIFFGGI